MEGVYYYAYTIIVIVEEILRRRSDLYQEIEQLFAEHAEMPDFESDKEKYLVWMCGRFLYMSKYSLKASTKAGRWIGWMLKVVEELGYWDNTRTRNLIRQDVRMGRDIPIYLLPPRIFSQYLTQRCFPPQK